MFLLLTNYFTGIDMYISILNIFRIQYLQMNTYLSLHERLNLFPTPRVYNTILKNRYSTEVKDVNNSNIISPEPVLLLDNMLLSSLRSTPVRKLFKYYLGLRKDNKLVIKDLPCQF